ncbi:hypothetical protein [Variovorax sp. E3]|uniref:hypothetical protein n=1 Tax=Variovorax sp. E3 TaxID=1914993 RepID=UPI0018DB2269|nr:hypothetical protein [Variovorax sp. E3]
MQKRESLLLNHGLTSHPWAPQRLLFIGMAIGHVHRSKPLGALQTERAPLDEVAEFNWI